MQKKINSKLEQTVTSTPLVTTKQAIRYLWDTFLKESTDISSDGDVKSSDIYTFSYNQGNIKLDTFFDVKNISDMADFLSE